MAYAIAQNTPILTTLMSSVNTVWDAFVSKMLLSSKHAQIVQLTQAMNRMDDRQLAAIGITRSEISDYASMTIRLQG